MSRIRGSFLNKNAVSKNNPSKVSLLPSYSKAPCIKSSKDILELTYELRKNKEEYLSCLYLDARNSLIRKDNIIIDVLNNQLIKEGNISFVTPLSTSSIILVYDYSTNSSLREKLIKKIEQEAKVADIVVSNFIITSERNDYSFLKNLKELGRNFCYIASEEEGTLFDSVESVVPTYEINISKINKTYRSSLKRKENFFQLQNRRYLGNKYKLLGFINDIISEKCENFESFCDIFAGTGVVGESLNDYKTKVISNDFLNSNYLCLKTFLATRRKISEDTIKKINYLNSLKLSEENYFSNNFGGTYFSMENAIKIGKIREEIEKISETEDEKSILICALLYATDKVANTVGHYDAFRKKLDAVKPLRLLVPSIDYDNNLKNEIYNEDANILIRKIYCDVLYIDPPYNSRQYSDAYHLLENLSVWNKPDLKGMAKKMDRSHIKSAYSFKTAISAFEDLIRNAKCKHILLSYNNTGSSKDARSNARMADHDIIQVLKSKGELAIFEKNYKAFTTGKSNPFGNTERIFYCKVS